VAMTLTELIERLSIMADECGDKKVVVRRPNHVTALHVAEVTTRLITVRQEGEWQDFTQVVIETE